MGSKCRSRRLVWLVYVVAGLMFSGCCTLQELGTPKPPKSVTWLGTPATNWYGTASYQVQVVPTKQCGGDDMKLQIRTYFNNGKDQRVSNQIIGSEDAMSGKTFTLEIGGNIWPAAAEFTLVVGAWIAEADGGSTADGVGTDKLTRTFYTNAPSRTVDVEYDHQKSFNIFSWADSSYRFRAAFESPGLKVRFLNSETSLRDSILYVAPSNDNLQAALDRFMDIYKNPGSLNYLAGVKNVQTNLDGRSNLAGLSLTTTQLTEVGWTFLFLDHILNNLSGDVSGGSGVTKVLIHELGHQVGGLSDNLADHNSPFCVMFQDFYRDGQDFDPNTNDPVVTRTLYLNPFFCPADLQRTRNKYGI